MTPLIYRIKDLEAHPEGVHVHTALDRDFFARALQDAEGVTPDFDRCGGELDAGLRYVRGHVRCQGRLSGSLALSCDRCLGPATLALDVPLDFTFMPPSEALPGTDDTFDPDDVDYAHHDREVVDLDAVVREQVLLSLPLSTLCQEECRGLCPSCGQDLNQGACACPPAEAHSPFAALKDLKV